MDTAPAVPDSDTSAFDAAYAFAERLIYATPEQLVIIVLVAMVSHLLNSFTTYPRILFVSDDPGSGKSTGLHFMRIMGWHAWVATNATEPAIKSKFLEGEILLIIDEISKLFGESGLNGKQSPKYTILVSGYEQGATAPFSNGKVAEDVLIHGVAAAAGLRTAAPKDLRDRSVIIHMRKAPNKVAELLEDALDASVRAEGFAIQDSLHRWCRSNADDVFEVFKNRLRGIHPKLTGRRRQIWGPMFAIAMVLGGDVPQRCLDAFNEIALDAGDRPVLLPEAQVLLDAADFTDLHGGPECFIFSADLLVYLKDQDRELYTKMSDRYLAKLMSRALGTTQTIRGTFIYDPDNGPGKPHKGWPMAEHLLRAIDLRQKLNMQMNEEPEGDEFDRFFD